MTSVCTLNFVAHVINSSDSVVLRMYPWRSWRTVNEPSYTNQQSPTFLVLLPAEVCLKNEANPTKLVVLTSLVQVVARH